VTTSVARYCRSWRRPVVIGAVTAAVMIGCHRGRRDSLTRNDDTSNRDRPKSTGQTSGDYRRRLASSAADDQSQNRAGRSKVVPTGLQRKQPATSSYSSRFVSRKRKPSRQSSDPFLNARIRSGKPAARRQRSTTTGTVRIADRRPDPFAAIANRANRRRREARTQRRPATGLPSVPSLDEGKNPFRAVAEDDSSRRRAEAKNPFLRRRQRLSTSSNRTATVARHQREKRRTPAKRSSRSQAAPFPSTSVSKSAASKAGVSQITGRRVAQRRPRRSTAQARGDRNPHSAAAVQTSGRTLSDGDRSMIVDAESIETSKSPRAQSQPITAPSRKESPPREKSPANPPEIQIIPRQGAFLTPEEPIDPNGVNRRAPGTSNSNIVQVAGSTTTESPFSGGASQAEQWKPVVTTKPKTGAPDRSDVPVAKAAPEPPAELPAPLPDRNGSQQSRIKTRKNETAADSAVDSVTGQPQVDSEESASAEDRSSMFPWSLGVGLLLAILVAIVARRRRQRFAV